MVLMFIVLTSAATLAFEDDGDSPWDSRIRLAKKDYRIRLAKKGLEEEKGNVNSPPISGHLG